jgi:PAS domain S-box-containing protein
MPGYRSRLLVALEKEWRNSVANSLTGLGENTGSGTDLLHSRLVRLVELSTIAASWLAAVWCSLILVSWQLNIQWFKDLVAGNPPAKANAAVCGLLAAISLLAQRKADAPAGQLRAGKACALLLLAIALLTLSEYISGSEFGLDELLVKELTVVAVAPEAGKMALGAAIAYALLGVALLVLNGGRRWLSVVEGACLTTLAIVMVTMLGYLYESSPLRTFGSFNQMALPTCFLLAMLGVGVLSARPSGQLMSLLLSRCRAAVMTRQLLPLVFLLAIGLGWLRLAGETAGYYDARFGLAIMVSLMICLLSAAVVASARTISRAEAAQSETNELLKQLAGELSDLYNNAPCGYQSIRDDGIVARANSTALDWLGYKREEVVEQMKFEDLLAEEHRQAFAQEFSKAMETGMARELEFNMLRKDGSTFPALLNALAWKDAAGRFKICRISIFDISDRKKLDETMRQARDAALEALQLKSAFVATVSHELRTPLAGIIGMNELLLSDGLSSSQKESAELIQGCAEHLLALVDDILDFSRIESGNLRIENRSFSLVSVIDEVMAVVEPTARSKNLNLIKVVDPDIPSSLSGDPARLKQILLNLLGNAVKFTDQGQVKLCAGLEYADKDQVVVKIAIQDTGIGIARHKQNLLFNPFSQVDSSLRRSYGGTGLGLAISKRIVELMGGLIGCDSDLGKGSVFFVTIPFKLAVAEAESQARQKEQVEKNGRRLSGDVLVVEDDPVLQSLLRKQLNLLGLTPRTVGSAEEGLKCLEESPYSLVLMDCHLPQMDGFTATREVRAREAVTGNHIPIIAMTASVMPDELSKCLSAGMDSYISKPYSLEELTAKLAPWLTQVSQSR